MLQVRRAALVLLTFAVAACGAGVGESGGIGSNGSSDSALVTTSSPVIINEVLANEVGSDVNTEFVELVNTSGAAVDVSGWTISDGTQVRHTFASGTRIGAGQAYVVFGGASAIPAGLTNAVAASTGTLSLGNGGDTVSLKDGSGALMGSVQYTSSLSGTDGVSMNRDPDGSASGSFVLHNTLSSLNSSAGTRVDGSAFGTSGGTDAGTDAGTPGTAHVFINEVLANEPGSSVSGEFVELVNDGTAAADLSGWTISDGSQVRHTFAAGDSLAAGHAVVVFGGASGVPSGLTNAEVASTGGLGLSNSGDSVTLANASGAAVDAITYGSALASQDGVSMNRDPDATAGANLVLHNTISMLSSSPGVRADGSAFNGTVSDGGTDGGVVDGGTDGGVVDGGTDGGVVDGGTDGGVVDGGTDGGVVDGGTDGGVVDGGTDGGVVDGGTDGGVVDGGTDGGTGSGTHLRLMAGNLTSGNYQSYDPGEGIRIFEAMKPDVAMIQEFNYGSDSDSDIRAFVDKTFGTNYYVFREGSGTTYQIPNGVISRYPIVAAGHWNDTQVANRGFAWAHIDIPGPHDLWAISVHLLTKGATYRATEADELVTYIRDNVPAGDYVVLAGDFNTQSRTEACITNLSAVLSTSAPYPVDQNGNGNTNSTRGHPEDWVLVDSSLDADQVPTVIGNETFADGLVFDTRVFTPISDAAPALTGDSGATNMQHMGVVRDFVLP